MAGYRFEQLLEFQQRLRPLLRQAETYVGGGVDHERGVLELNFNRPVPAGFEEQAATVVPTDCFVIRLPPPGKGWGATLS